MAAVLVLSLALRCPAAETSPAPAPTALSISILARDAVTRAGIPHVHVQLESDYAPAVGFYRESLSAH